MARWVSRLHNLYFAQRSALFVRLALLYKDVFFRIDARSDLDSQDRFFPRESHFSWYKFVQSSI